MARVLPVLVRVLRPPIPGVAFCPACSVDSAWQTDRDGAGAYGAVPLCVSSARYARGGRRAVYPARASRETQAAAYSADTPADCWCAIPPASNPPPARLE